MAFQTVDLTTSYDLSSQGLCTIGTVELGGFTGGTLTIQGESVENYARGDGGWVVNAPGKRSGTLEVTFLKLSTDACQNGIRGLMLSADYQKKGVNIVFRSEKAETSAGTGFKGVFTLTSISEKQQEGGQAVECTAQFAAYGAIELDNAAAASGSGAGN